MMNHRERNKGSQRTKLIKLISRKSTGDKNNLKQILKSSGKEINTQTNLYWFALIPRATSSSQKALSIHYTINHILQTHNHQRSDLDPHHKHTTNQNAFDSVNTSNLQNYKSRRNRIDHTWYKSNQSTNQVLLHS